MLTFDNPTHTYYWNGVRVPGVTSVIDDLLSWDHIPRDRLDHAREEGRAIHMMAEYHWQGTLDVDSLPDWLRPRYEALLKFVADTDFQPMAWERQVYHKRYCYAGTLDAFGAMRIAGKPGCFALLDIKRTLYGGRVTGLQLAGYEMAYDDEPSLSSPGGVARFALHLKDNGRYELEPFTDRNDHGAFLACLTRHRFKESMKCKT